MPEMTPSDAAAGLVAAWNAPNAEARVARLAEVAVPDLRYLDPHAPAPVTGIDGLAVLIGLFRERFDHVLVIDGSPDAHNGFFRFRWRLERSDGDQLSRGDTFGEQGEDGRIVQIVQFVDRAA